MDEVGRSISFREAIDLVDELRREFGSHLNAHLNGWDFAAGYGEVMAAVHANSFMNVNRDEKKQREPFELPLPWSSSQKQEQVTPEERAVLRASLLRRSAFANQ